MPPLWRVSCLIHSCCSARQVYISYTCFMQLLTVEAHKGGTNAPDGVCTWAEHLWTPKMISNAAENGYCQNDRTSPRCSLRPWCRWFAPPVQQSGTTAVEQMLYLRIQVVVAADSSVL